VAWPETLDQPALETVAVEGQCDTAGGSVFASATHFSTAESAGP
jgi:hypothetical protein